MEHKGLKLSLAGLLFLAALAVNSSDAHSQTPAAPPAATRVQAETVAAPQSPQDDVTPPPDRAAATSAESAPEVSAPLRRRFDVAGLRDLTGGAASSNAGSALLGPEAPQGGGGAQQNTYTPLTPEGKMKRAFRKAFLSPEGYARSAISAALTEWGEDDLPHKDTDDRIADGLSRFAIKTGTRATRTLLGSGVYAVLFKQDPRYERAEGKGIGRRVLHAASRVWVTRGDNGKLQPNYSRWAGSLSASALSNIWEQSTPGHDRKGVDATFRRFGKTFISDTWQTIVFSEFFPDLMRIFRR